MVTTPNFRSVITIRNEKPSLVVSSISTVLLSLDVWYKVAKVYTSSLYSDESFHNSGVVIVIIPGLAPEGQQIQSKGIKRAAVPGVLNAWVSRIN